MRITVYRCLLTARVWSLCCLPLPARFGLLDGRIMPEDPHCVAAVLTKTAVDQLLFAPFGLLLFFVCIKMLEGRPRDIPGALRTK